MWLTSCYQVQKTKCSGKWMMYKWVCPYSQHYWSLTDCYNKIISPHLCCIVTWIYLHASYMMKSLIRILTETLQTVTGNLYCQQTSKEPISNHIRCIWVTLSSFLACWSFAWLSSHALCHSQSCSKIILHFSNTSLKTI